MSGSKEDDVSTAVATRAEAELPAAAASVAQTRRFVRSTLEAWQLETLTDTATLLTSELATNALLHARSGFTVRLERRDTGVRVALLDDSAMRPTRRSHGLEATTGRGLALVETLAADWGSVEEEALDGKAKGVWFELSADSEDTEHDEGALFGEAWLAAIDDL